MRPKHKGSALFYGSAFDAASDVLLHQRDLLAAKEKFTDLWMAQEQNLNCKFSKTDLEVRLYEQSDISKLEAAASNLNHSKAKQGFEKDCDVIKLLKEIKKMKEQSFMRDLTLEEERFLHYATVLSMLRKGYLMLDSFYANILPKITRVVSTQTKVDIQDGAGNEITGYIDLLCNMEGYELSNGRKLTSEDLVVADVKTASATYWEKLDNIEDSDQLDGYLCSPQVQSLQSTNLVCYMAISKQISKIEKSFCKSCGHEKSTTHKKCNNEVDGKRCNGDWNESVTYFCESKIVIAERNLQEAAQIYTDYDHIVRAIQADIYPRNRESCMAYNQVCEYKDICGKCFSSVEQEELALEKWRADKGE
jgi:hypothetical protein